MTFDLLSQSETYLDLHPHFAKAFAFLNRSDIKELPVGRHEIDGDQVFAVIAKDQGRTKEEAELETHRRYIDIQAVLAGVDEMGWKALADCTQPTADYDETTDLQFFADPPEVWLPTKAGAFAIFFPEDAHMPLISDGVVHKVIVKVAVV